MPSATPYESTNAPRSELQELQLKSQQVTDDVSLKLHAYHENEPPPSFAESLVSLPAISMQPWAWVFDCVEQGVEMRETCEVENLR